MSLKKISGRAVLHAAAGLMLCLFTGILFRLSVLPAAATMGLAGAGFILWLAAIMSERSCRKGLKVLGRVFSALLLLLSSLGSWWAWSTDDALSSLSGRQTETHSITLYAMDDSGFADLEDVKKDNEIGLVSTGQDEHFRDACAGLQKELGFAPSFRSYSSTVKMVDNFRGRALDLILIDRGPLEALEELEDYQGIEEKMVPLYTYTYTTRKEKKAGAQDLLDKPFTMLISGSDSRSGVREVARSDVNILMTVDPVRHNILLTSVPRDYYVDFYLDGTGQPAYRDKLTHAGLHGVDATRRTLEQLLDVRIDHDVKICFSTVVELVDMLGGIDIDNPNEFTSLYGKYDFQKGRIHLNGDQALGYARERYSFAAGDRERGRNQMRVISGVIKKVGSSPSLIARYPQMLRLLASTFETDLPASALKAFARYQLSEGPRWNVYAFSLDGPTGTEMSPELGAPASVMYIDEDTVKLAAVNIAAVKNGEKPPYVYDLSSAGKSAKGSQGKE